MAPERVVKPGEQIVGVAGKGQREQETAQTCEEQLPTAERSEYVDEKVM